MLNIKNAMECIGETKCAVINVDLQFDFMSQYGSLYVPDSEKIMSNICQLADKLYFAPFVFTKDFHPANHCSFKEFGGKWPNHCVAGEDGSKFIFMESEGIFSVDDIIIFKGIDQKVDSYSAFFDNDHATSTGLDKILKVMNIKYLFFTGVATNFCVKYSVLDALKLGYSCFVVLPCCCGIDIKPGDVKKSIDEMRDNGANLIENM